MKLIPLLKCNQIEKSIQFYTSLLDFTVTDLWNSPDNSYQGCRLKSNETELMLSTFPEDGTSGNIIYLTTDTIDEVFANLVFRGIDTSHKNNSPVHQHPVDQPWGMREFYLDDPDGNTIRFSQPIRCL
jgi:uncharacterized glyoxalase superfamily protein PhnB